VIAQGATAQFMVNGIVSRVSGLRGGCGNPHENIDFTVP
jgi:hypothetical protein